MSDTTAPRAEVLRTRDFVGWAVTGRDGANVGTVSDILIDRGGRVRFLAVEEPGMFRKRTVLLPVESMDWGDGALTVGWSESEVRALPPYDGDVPLTGAVLEELERAYPRHYGAGGDQPLPVPGDGPRVVPLKDAKEFRLAKGAPNLRGWSVYGSDNEKVGTVVEMLVDPAAMKIRYLDVDVDDDLFALTDDRHVLVPLEAVELRERSRDAWVTNLAAREIVHLPAYMGGPVDPLVDEAVRRSFRVGDAGYASPPAAAYVPPAESEAPPLPQETAAPPPLPDEGRVDDELPPPPDAGPADEELPPPPDQGPADDEPPPPPDEDADDDELPPPSDGFGERPPPVVVEEAWVPPPKPEDDAPGGR